MKNHYKLLSLLLFVFVLGLNFSACKPVDNNFQPVVKVTITPTKTKLFTASPTHTSTPTLTQLPSSTPTSTLVPTATPIGPPGCKKPADRYELVTINGMSINQRTYDMLLYAQELYGGELQLTGYHLTQGSYTNQVSASFGTHNGGGAVDLSVIQYGTYQVIYDDIEPLILALRTSGFAAWLRTFDQLYPGSPIHIHAIAIGDRDLSPAAQAQLSGDFGYFRGYNGLPQEQGFLPISDEHNGPIICQWMLDLGYEDLREENKSDY